MTELAIYDAVTVIADDDTPGYVGQTGYIAGSEVGLVTGRLVYNVILDGRHSDDPEGFYGDQLALHTDNLVSAA